MQRRGLWLGSILVALAACSGGDVVKMSAVLPLTGEFEIYGQAVRKGVELAYEELKANSEYPYNLELEIVDTTSSPAQAKELLQTQYDGGALAVIGGVMSVEALQMVEVADRFDRVLISPSASTPQLTGISKNFYRVFPSDSREGTAMGNYAYQELEMKNAVILAKVDPYAKGIQEVFQAEFERNGGEVLDTIEYPEGAADFSGFVERILSLEPDGVYVAAYAGDIGRIISELKVAGYEGRILTTSAFAAPEAIEQIGNHAEGVFLTLAGFDAAGDDPTVTAFVEAFRAKYGLTPDLYAAHGYDALMVLSEAIIKSGPAATDLWKSVRGLRDYVGVTGTIQFDERGDAQKFPRVYKIENGNLIDHKKVMQERREDLLRRLQELQDRQRRQAG